MKLQVAYILLGIIGACLLLEGALRITDSTDYNRFENDPLSGLLHYKENYSFTEAASCYSNTVVTNSQGLHAPQPPSAAKKPNEFRIVLVGGSFVEALPLPLNQIVSADLEQLLNAQSHKTYTYEVEPVAFSGNGTFLDILYYKRYGEPLNPNLVIDITTEYEYTHDATSGARFNTQGNLITALPASDIGSKTALIKSLARQSKLVMNLFNRFTVIKDTSALPTPSVTSSTEESQASAWSNEERLLGAFADIVDSDHALFLVASWSTPLAGTSTSEALHAHLTDAAATNNFYYDDMLPFISDKEAQTGVSASWSCDPHWSSAGDEYAAEAIFTYLQAHPALMGK